MFGNIGKMMKLAGEMKTKLPEMQKKLADSHYIAQAGGGAVIATVDGKLQLVDLKIDQAVLADADAGMLEDLVKAAVGSAQRQAVEAAAAAMNELTGGMDLSDMGGLGSMLGM